jgi:hypothetical protein
MAPAGVPLGCGCEEGDPSCWRDEGPGGAERFLGHRTISLLCSCFTLRTAFLFLLSALDHFLVFSFGPFLSSCTYTRTLHHFPFSAAFLFLPSLHRITSLSFSRTFFSKTWDTVVYISFLCLRPVSWTGGGGRVGG